MKIKKNLKSKILNLKSTRGGAVLLLVLVLTISGLAMAIGATEMGIDDITASYESQEGKKVFALSEGCTEDTLRRIRRNNNYGVGMGTLNLNLDEGSCEIEVDDLGGDRRRITSVATIEQNEQSLIIDIALDGDTIVMEQWQEI